MMEQLNLNFYQAPTTVFWNGRIDGVGAEHERWHQRIELVDLTKKLQDLKNSYVFLGFKCDEGVNRNQGRVGAKDGPDAIRKVLANLPIHHQSKIYDAGDVNCNNGDLEGAQDQLAIAVSCIKHAGAFPIILGGGHEVTYGHFKGLKNHNKSIGIINIDAHFDLRENVNQISTSGTGFYQIAEEVGVERFHYLALGIQQISNTKALFDRAAALRVDVITQTEITSELAMANKIKIEQFLDRVDEVYLTIDLDAICASYAPGVSSLAFQGIVPNENFFKLLSLIYQHPKLVSMDIAELNPLYDIDNRTARLAADLIFRKIQ